MDLEQNTLDRSEVESKEDGSVSPLPRRQRLMKLFLLLASIAFSAAAFLALDCFRSAAIVGKSKSKLGRFSCGTLDPLRVFALKPNCASVMPWGANPYEFSANCLGLRDVKVRDVPVTDDRPRILMLGNSFTQGMGKWQDTYVDRVAAHFPQYDVLNGGVMLYPPPTTSTWPGW